MQFVFQNSLKTVGKVFLWVSSMSSVSAFTLVPSVTLNKLVRNNQTGYRDKISKVNDLLGK